MSRKQPERKQIIQKTLSWFRDFGHSDQTLLISLSVVVGVLAGLSAVGFRKMVHLFTQLVWRGMESPLEAAEIVPWWLVILIPAAGGLLVGLLIRYAASEVKGHGVPEVMEAVALREGRMRLRIVPLKALASAITIGSGGSAGREGPIVLIGSALGSTIGRISKLPADFLRILVAAGAAGGIGATFNTPIAGAIFAAEIILGDFGVAHFTPVVIGSVMATAVSRSFLGDNPTFAISPDGFQFVSVWELIPYAILGLLAAITAVLFTKILATSTDLFDNRLSLPDWLRPAVGGLLLGMLALAVPQVMGVGYGTMENMLSNQHTWPWVFMFLILGAKMLATSLTLGSGGSGGIFSPTLFMGAMLGGGLGSIVHAIAPASTATPGAYAMVGMGALVAATTHAPLTAALMLFELTANYRIILPLMLACSLATLIATRLSSVSIYTEKLKKRGIVLSHGREVNILRNIPVSSVPLAEAATVSKDASLSSLMALLASSTHSRFFLLDENGALSGSIDLVDLRKVIPDQEHLRHVLVAEDVATFQIHPVTPEATLNNVMMEFGRSHVDELPVVDSEGSRNLIGVVRRQDVIARYNREMLKMDMAEEMRRGVEDAASMKTVPLGDRYLLAEIPVPVSMENMALSETELRSRYRVEVVMIKPLDGDEAVIPEGNQILKEGDQLLVVGDRDAVSKLRNLK